MANDVYFVTKYTDDLGTHYNIGTGDVQSGHTVIFLNLTYNEASEKVKELTTELNGYSVVKTKDNTGRIKYQVVPDTQAVFGELVKSGLANNIAQELVNGYNADSAEYNKSLDAAPPVADINAKVAEQLLKYEKEKKLGYWEDYYTGCDVGIFIGDIWVDDVVTIQYTLTNNKSPIYGYMSEKFDAVTRGTTIVQGQFAIAFKETGYLTTILKNYQYKNGNASRTIEELLGESELEKRSYIDKKTGKEVVEFIGVGSAELAFTNAEQGTPDRADRWGYLDMAYGNIIDKGFDIVVTYGDVNEQFRGGTVEKLNEVHITSRSIVCEPTGEPIAEMYNFFARTYNESLPSRIFGMQNQIEAVESRVRNVAQQTPAQDAADALRLENDRKALNEKDKKRKTSWEKTMEAIREARE